MATAPTLEATPELDAFEDEAPETAPVLTDGSEEAAEKPATFLSFEVDGYNKPIELDIASIPQDTRMKLLRNAVKAYITNRLSTAASKAKTQNAAFDSFEAASANDPLQTLVPKPEGERVNVDYAEISTKAINDLIAGKLAKRGSGTKAKTGRDPLNTQITRAVVAKVFANMRALDPNAKYPLAQKEVGYDGMEYLLAKVEENVAKGADRAQQMRMLQTVYINPAKIMLGIDTPKSVKDQDSIL